MKLPEFIPKETLLMAFDSVRAHKFRSFLTVLGIVIIAILRNGLLLAGVPSTWQLFILGVLLLVAVFLNEFFRRGEE